MIIRRDKRRVYDRTDTLFSQGSSICTAVQIESEEVRNRYERVDAIINKYIYTYIHVCFSENKFIAKHDIAAHTNIINAHEYAYLFAEIQDSYVS